VEEQEKSADLAMFHNKYMHTSMVIEEQSNATL
jgi:hypothetical protein